MVTLKIGQIISRKYDIDHIEVQLIKRKQSQTGNVMPFKLYLNDVDVWLCPIRAYARLCSFRCDDSSNWLLFGTLQKNDGIPRVCDGHLLRDDLCKAGIDPKDYGTHSFRRGGAQQLAKEGIPITDIINIGGWENISVAVGYLHNMRVSSFEGSDPVYKLKSLPEADRNARAKDITDIE